MVQPLDSEENMNQIRGMVLTCRIPSLLSELASVGDCLQGVSWVLSCNEEAVKPCFRLDLSIFITMSTVCSI